jgi:nitrite reductase/ring-hydroxylating ferredoxin subunit
LIRRVDGKLFALKDQCAHRGVRLSAKPTCFTKTTITCWYHGFTYDLASGRLATIVGNPDDPLVGTTGITIYPVEEVKKSQASFSFLCGMMSFLIKTFRHCRQICRFDFQKIARNSLILYGPRRRVCSMKEP